MPAGLHNLTIEQGATFRRVISLRDYNTNAIKNLTGFTARMQIRAFVADTATLVSLTTENGGITIDAAEGQITLIITAAVTASMTWRKAVYDLEIIDGSGTVTRLLQGSIIVSPEVTR